MKKFLSLVLALVMTMSLVTISAGAEDFNDAADITYVEAVEVLTALDVVDGDTAGNFNPTNGLTRGAAAKIICNLILGPTTASALNADTNPYPDVDKDSTFAGYIAYCQKEGIISGYADGTFKAANPLTGYAFMKMLLGALGYDADVEGYVGANWSINVAKQAIGIGLEDGLKSDFNGSGYVTREEAMLYAFNTLMATMVDYDTTITIGDITVAGSNEYAVANNAKTESIASDDLMQFAEKYFPSLNGKRTTDEFGRPATEWKIGTDSVGVFADEADAVYYEAVKVKDVYAELGMDETLVADAVVDGVDVDDLIVSKKGDTYTSAVSGVGTGSVVEFFYDDVAETLDMIVINQYLAEVTKVKTDDDGEYIVVSTADRNAKTLKDKTFYVEGYEAEDMVVLNVTVDDNGDTYVAAVYDPETAVGVVTAIERDNGQHDYIEMDDEKYVYNDAILTSLADPILTDEYTLYLDANGYVVGFDAAEEAAKTYAYVQDVAQDMWGDWEAKLLFSDATEAVVDIVGNGENLKATTGYVSNNANLDGWVVSYTKSSKDVYTLTCVGVPGNSSHIAANAVQKADLAELNNKSAWVENVLTDEDTVFVDVKDEITYTGFENIPDYATADVVIVKDSSNVAEVVFIIDWASKTNSDSTIFYVAKVNDWKTKENADEVQYAVRTVYVDGVKTTVEMELTATANGAIDADGWYRVDTVNDDGYVVKVTALGDDSVLTASTNHDVSVKGKGTFVNGQTTALDTTAISSQYWYYNNDTLFVVIDGDTVTVGDISDMVKYVSTLEAGDEYTKAVVVESDKNMAEVVALYVTAIAEDVVPEVPNVDSYTGTIVNGNVYVDASLTGIEALEAAVATAEAYGYTLNAPVGENETTISVVKNGIVRTLNITSAVSSATSAYAYANTSAAADVTLTTAVEAGQVKVALKDENGNIVAVTTNKVALSAKDWSANFTAAARTSSTWDDGCQNLGASVINAAKTVDVYVFDVLAGTYNIEVVG